MLKLLEKNNVKALRKIVKDIKEKFIEFKAYVKYTGEPIYLFRLKPGEEVEIPIILKAPLGKVNRKYLFGIVLIIPLIIPYDADGYSVFGAGGLYIGP